MEPDRAEAVADGLWLLRGNPRHWLNVYVMGDVLVDAGTRHASRRILRAVHGTRLSAHVLTHAHMDHMGATNTICAELDLPLICGAGDVGSAASGDGSA